LSSIEFGTTQFCPVLEGARIAKESEDMGFDVQLIGENHNMVADVFGELRDGARATSRIKLMCGPVNFVTRDPGVVASSIGAIQVLSGGRAICGIARGDSAVALAGKSPQRQAALAADLDLLRRYLNRETVLHGDRESALHWIRDHSYTPPPIELVCSGPNAIALAARSADRIGLSVGANPERIRWALDIIDNALAVAGRRRADVRIGVYFPLAMAKDRTEGRALLKLRTAGFAHMSSFKGNDLSQQPPIMRRVSEKLRTGYDYRFHRADAPPVNANTELIDEEFADWFGIGGPPPYVIERIGELIDLGVKFFNAAFWPGDAEAFAASVIPAFR